MEYLVRENVSGIKLEVKCGNVSIMQGEGYTVKINVPDTAVNGIRIFSHSSTLFIKYILPIPIEVQLCVPKTIHNINITSGSCKVTFEDIELDNVIADSCSNIIMKNVVIVKSCQLNTEDSYIRLIDSDISSMNIQLIGGSLDFCNTVLHGNNTAYIVNSSVGGSLKGALVDYVISAGSGIDPDNVIVNDHFLSEFPNRKNVQNCAWLLLAGSLSATSRIKISKPRLGMYNPII